MMSSHRNTLVAAIFVGIIHFACPFVQGAECLLSTMTRERLPFRVVHKMFRPPTSDESVPNLHYEMTGHLIRHADEGRDGAASAYTIEIVGWNVLALNKNVLVGGDGLSTAPLEAPVRMRIECSDGVWQMPAFEDLDIDSLTYLKKGAVTVGYYAVISAATLEFNPAPTGDTGWSWRVGRQKWGLLFPIELDRLIARPDARWEFQKRRDETGSIIASCAVSYPHRPNDAQLYCLKKVQVLASYPSGTIHRARLEGAMDMVRDPRMLRRRPREEADPPLADSIPLRKGREWFDTLSYQTIALYDVLFDHESDGEAVPPE